MLGGWTVCLESAIKVSSYETGELSQPVDLAISGIPAPAGIVYT